MQEKDPTMENSAMRKGERDTKKYSRIRGVGNKGESKQASMQTKRKQKERTSTKNSRKIREHALAQEAKKHPIY